MFEIDAKQLIDNKIKQLTELYHESDSRETKTAIDSQIELLKTFVTPIIWKLDCDLEETTRQLHILIKENKTSD